MRWLEEEVTRITGKNDQVMKENLLLRHVLEEQSVKINELVRRSDERQKKKTESVEIVKSEPAEEPKPKKKVTSFWRPGVEDEKDETATVVSATTSGVGTTATTTPESLVQMRLNLPVATPAAQALPYAAMLEQVNIVFLSCSWQCQIEHDFNILIQHSRAALPFYHLAGLTAAHGYNPLAPTTSLSNGNYLSQFDAVKLNNTATHLNTLLNVLFSLFQPLTNYGIGNDVYKLQNRTLGT